MVILILLFLSTILSFVLINYIPFGLEDRQKKIISIAVPIIGSLGLAFSSIANAWQSVLVMILLAALAGYILITKTTNLPENDGISNMMDEENLSKKEVNVQPPNEFKRKENNEISISNAISSKQEELRIVDDISFLEVRNNQELELSELDVIPVLDFESSKDKQVIVTNSKP